jgi:hypothetical protein
VRILAAAVGAPNLRLLLRERMSVIPFRHSGTAQRVW